MTEIIRPLLLIESMTLGNLVEEYRVFFIGLLPTIFILAVIVEYLDRLEPLLLVKRAFISILILTSVTSFYALSINASFEVAESKIQQQKNENLFLMNFLDANEYTNKLLEREKKSFYKDRNILTGTFAFLKYQMFDSFINDGFTVTTYFIAKLCFVILKVVYSLVYYLGIGLIGVPCLVYLFSTMGNVLRGAILSFIWCLVVPHVLVFIISMIGAEINKGYSTGTIIGGTVTGTAFLFIMTLFIAFTPLITVFILSGSGMAQAGGIIASIGANWIMNLPKNSLNTGATLMTGGTLGPKSMMAKNMMQGGFKLAKSFKPDLNRFRGTKNSSSSMREASSKNQQYAFGHQKIKGHLPHTSESEYVTMKNSSKGSGVDFISAPTRNSSAYKAEQKLQVHPTPTVLKQNRTGRINNGELPKHEQVNRRDQKAYRSYRSSRNRSQYYRFNNRYRSYSPSGERSL